MKHLIVLNGSAGSFAEELKTKAEAAFAGVEHEIYETTGPRSVIPFLKNYLTENKDEVVRIYACGGDGTVHEVANAIVGFDNAELAIIATGTGNDFIKIYGGKEKFQDFAPFIEAPAKPIDISKLESKSMEEPWYSINVINFGFDAIVGAMGNYYKENGYPEKAKAKGMSPYDYALKHDAMKHGLKNAIEVEVDGKKVNNKTMLLCTIAQGQYVGGQFHCSPKSDNTDGVVDVIVLKAMSILGLGMIIGPYTRGEHLNKKRSKVLYNRGKEVKFYGPEDFDVCVDGEMIRGNNFKVTVLPGAIKLVLPQ